MSLLVLGALFERGWMCQRPDLGLFGFLFCSCVVSAFVFLSLVHVFRCHCIGAVGAILP